MPLREGQPAPTMHDPTAKSSDSAVHEREALSSKRLDSWKEIASFLGRDERTAQRWRKERGLPVHHVPGGKRGGVFAYPPELDAWLHEQPADALHNGDATVRDGNEVSEKLAEEVPASTATLVDETAFRARGRTPGLVMGISIGLVLALAALGVFWGRPWLSFAATEPTRLVFSGKQLAALDGLGKVLWKHELPGPAYDSNAPEWAIRTVFQDVDGDGRAEVLAGVRYTDPANAQSGWKSELLCFSSSGKVLWRYVPDYKLSFGGREFGGPWGVRRVIVTGTGKDARVWAAVDHNTWWPSVLVQLDSTGKELTRFVNSGYLYGLAEWKTPRGTFILAGGINNEYDGAIVAVLPADAPTGHSPGTAGSPYACDNCPVGQPLHYFLFPRSELNRATVSTYNQGQSFQMNGENMNFVIEETYGTNDGNTGSFSYYEFSPQFRLVRQGMGDRYWDLHKKLSAEGKVKHSVEACREHAHPPIAREWREGKWPELGTIISAKK